MPCFAEIKKGLMQRLSYPLDLSWAENLLL